MVCNLNCKNRIFIARAVFESLVTVLAERTYSSTIQIFDSFKDIPNQENPPVQESHRLLGMGKMSQTLQCYLIAKYKEVLRNNEKAFYKRRKLEAQIDD